MAEVTVADVLLHGAPVGTLTRLGDDRILFAFNEGYIADENRPTLGLGFKDRLGDLITDFRPTRTRALPFFSNLLPEGHLRTYLAERAGVNPEREFFLLRALGEDLFHQHWESEKKNLPLSGDVKRAVETHAGRIPIA